MPFKSSQAGRKGSDRKPIQKDAVIETADQDQAPGASTIDREILERIQKCLDRAHHANLSELEAKAACPIRLPKTYEPTQCDTSGSFGQRRKQQQGFVWRTQQGPYHKDRWLR
ncbi:uncharacterized protein N7473_001839 [Penicillium subrubescens]|uniref:Uncharacterized protein n=1 Tax=Penicillium subrubescens TaxID=1316194 RepID=A0A1Q5UB83_9EURO|nr:uncharacterized protein N7473_001839 [Penicillium subrubescens]KAJ5904923.1 hypothetical protein N7473_001839 [Penicillium subrubescens]OKP09734.1 hypothetical protein PENSUB_4878 [Penicillium subrubescens]